VTQKYEARIQVRLIRSA